MFFVILGLDYVLITNRNSRKIYYRHVVNDKYSRYWEVEIFRDTPFYLEEQPRIETADDEKPKRPENNQNLFLSVFSNERCGNMEQKHCSLRYLCVWIKQPQYIAHTQMCDESGI